MSTLVTEFRSAKHSKKLVGDQVIVKNVGNGILLLGEYVYCHGNIFQLRTDTLSTYQKKDWTVIRIIERIEK